METTNYNEAISHIKTYLDGNSLLCCDEGGNFDVAVEKVEDLSKKILGEHDYNIFYNFFVNILANTKPAIMFALSKKGYLLARIFLALIVKNKPGVIPENFRLLSDRSVELHTDDITKAKNIAIIDEICIYGRSILRVADKVKKIKKDISIGENEPNLYLYTCMANCELIKKSVGNPIRAKGEWGKLNLSKENFIINYLLEGNIRRQKELIFKLVELIYGIGIPFCNNTPIVGLNETETEKIMQGIKDDNKYEVLTPVSCFKNTEQYVVREVENKNTLGEMPKCFRINRNNNTKRSFIMPYVLTPDIDISTKEDIECYISEIFDKVNKNEYVKKIIDEINSINNQLKSRVSLKEIESKDSYIEIVKYRLAAYFVNNKYLIDTISYFLCDKENYSYVSNGFDEHFTDIIGMAVKNLQKEHCLIKIIGEYAEKWFMKHMSYNEMKSSEEYRAYRAATEKFISNLDINEDFNDIKKEEYREAYKANKFDSYMQLMGLIEDKGLDRKITECGNKLQDIELRDFVRHGYESLVLLIDRIKKYHGSIPNYVLAKIIERADLNVITLNCQAFDVESEEPERKAQKSIGVVIRPGEEISMTWGGYCPDFTAAFETYWTTTLQTFWNNDEDTEKTYKNFSKGEVYQKIYDKQLVKILLKYLEKNHKDINDLKYVLVGENGEIDGYNIKMLKEVLTPNPSEEIKDSETFKDCINIASRFTLYYDSGITVGGDVNSKFENVEDYRMYKEKVEKYASSFNVQA